MRLLMQMVQIAALTDPSPRQIIAVVREAEAVNTIVAVEPNNAVREAVSRPLVVQIPAMIKK